MSIRPKLHLFLRKYTCTRCVSSASGNDAPEGPEGTFCYIFSIPSKHCFPFFMPCLRYRRNLRMNYYSRTFFNRRRWRENNTTNKLFTHVIFLSPNIRSEPSVVPHLIYAPKNTEPRQTTGKAFILTSNNYSNFQRVKDQHLIRLQRNEKNQPQTNAIHILWHLFSQVRKNTLCAFVINIH